MKTDIKEIQTTLLHLDGQITNLTREVEYWQGRYDKERAWAIQREATIDQLKQQIHHLTRAIQIGEDVKAVG